MAEAEEVRRFLEEVVDRAAQPGQSALLTTGLDRAGLIVSTLAPVAQSRDWVLDSVLTNGRRVDVSVHADDRVWGVVLSIDAEGVHSASVFERPSQFPGVSGGRAVILNGPSSVGKSSVMRAVVDIAATPWVMFDEPSFGSVRMPFLIWPDTAPTLRAGFVAGITALAAAGNQVILSGRDASAFNELRATVSTLAVRLDCPLETRVARQAGRDDRWGGLTEGDTAVHTGWVYGLEFDTSERDPLEIATAILGAVELMT